MDNVWVKRINEELKELLNHPSIVGERSRWKGLVERVSKCEFQKRFV